MSVLLKTPAARQATQEQQMLPITKHNKGKQHNIQGQEQKAPPPWVYTTAERRGWAVNAYLMSNEHVHLHVASPLCKGCHLVTLTALPAATCDVWHGHVLLQSSVEARDLGLHAAIPLTLLKLRAICPDAQLSQISEKGASIPLYSLLPTPGGLG